VSAVDVDLSVLAVRGILGRTGVGAGWFVVGVERAKGPVGMNSSLLGLLAGLAQL
jgi:hypothetical protein